MDSYTSPITCNNETLGPSLAQYCNATAFVAFATILNSLLRSKNEISGVCERVHSIEPDNVYDFIVIGGGAAGSVVASRLSEICDWDILLLEAGGDESVAAEVPILAGTLLGTPLDWNYTTSHERYSCLSKNGSCSLPAGKMLGGSTAHNAMLYTRGNPSDYDGWAALGNKGWSFADVLPYFKKAENNGEIKRVGTKYHSTGGPLSVERLPYYAPFGNDLFDAAVEAGFNLTEDLNGDNNNGFTLLQTTSKHGVRCSSATAYLRPVRNRTNLHISLYSTASKVIIENGIAVGVEYYKNGKFNTIRARKEVIVSAGAIGSPKLLLLSGIGPKEHLKSVGVEPVHDLCGVGENYHDQVAYSFDLTINENFTYDYDWATATEYLNFQTGPMSGEGLTTVRGWVSTNLTTFHSPDIRIGFVGYTSACAPGTVGALRSSGKRTIQLNAANLQPKSRGKVSLVSNNFTDYPLIWGNHLSEPEDVDRLIQGIKLALKIPNTKAMRAHNVTVTSEPVEACSDYTYGTDKYWTCALRQRSTAQMHNAGSCKMGNSSDSMAVVDHRLRVYGLKGLRVADTSIAPQVTSSNTAAPTMMIGERAAAFIKEDWKQKSGGDDCKPKTPRCC